MARPPLPVGRGARSGRSPLFPSGSHLRTRVRQNLTILAATGMLLASSAGVVAAATPVPIGSTLRIVSVSPAFVPVFTCYGLPTPRSVPCRM